MSAGSLARRFAHASGAPSGRAAGAVLAALFFLLLPAAAQEPVGAKAGRRAGPKVITNKDLEPLRLRREAQEAEYERTHRERGLPSSQELRQHFEEQDRRLHEAALQIEKERAEAELMSVRSELVNIRRDLSVLGLRLSQSTGTYVTAHEYPSYYPHYYAPPVWVITRFPSGHRGVFGHGQFGHHHRGGAWLYNRRQRLFSNAPGRPPLYRSTPPRAPAQPMPVFRR